MTTSNVYENTTADNELTSVFLALHSGDPGETGANEIAGGSYIRQAVTWNAAAGGVKTNSSVPSFAGQPAVVSPGIVAFSLWDAATAGNCRHIGWLTNTGELMRYFVMADTTTDLMTSPTHGFANTDMVVLVVEIANAIVPTGLVAGTIYFVISSTADTFQLSATSGGAAINLTGKGQGFVQRIVPKIVNAGDTTQFAAGTLSFVKY